MPDIEKEAAQLLANLEKDFATASLPAPSDTLNTVSDEFVGLCIQMRAAPRDDVNIVLEQMQVLLETLPLPVLVQHPNALTLRTLLQFALETRQEKPRLRCRALGFLQLERCDANDTTARTSEAQGELLTFFALQPRRPWTDEQIYEALWQGKNPQRAQWSFHSARKRLHQFVGEEIVVMLKRGQYVLNPNFPIWFDVTEFESLLLRAGAIPNANARIKLLESAVQFYHGDFLEKNYKDWVVPVRTRLREKYIGALLQLGELNRLQAPEQAIVWYEKALLADDLNEEGYLKLIELQVQCNNPISAQRTLLLCQESFQREMGTTPSSEFMRAARSRIDGME